MIQRHTFKLDQRMFTAVLKDLLCCHKEWLTNKIHDSYVLKLIDVNKKEVQEEIYEWLKLRVKEDKWQTLRS